ncbi:MAG TPA: Trm112 family protein, partial [Anaerolineae bacterium]|nr:Trm112 family protein [Anaerolineae bacterium]
MHNWLMDLLECPACHGTLEWDVTGGTESRIEAGAATCRGCAAVYPIRDGIGLFLLPDVRRRDLWEQVDNRLLQHLRERPDVRRQLMDTPTDALGAADLF